jgi:hypothetical protein
LVVTVTSLDRNEPVSGATVNVTLTDKDYAHDTLRDPLRVDTQATGEDGKVWVIPSTLGGFAKVKPEPGDRFDVTVTHPDFFEAVIPVPITKDNTTGDISVPVALKRKMDRKAVAVHVFSADVGDKVPIYEANVTLKGTKNGARFSGTTNANGQTLLNVTESDEYDVTVTRTGYEPVKGTVTVKVLSDENQYELRYEMVSTGRNTRTLRVFVTGADARGQVVPVRDAAVNLANGIQTASTDSSGTVTFEHKLPPGEEFTVNVEATGHKSGSVTFTVGVRAGSGDTANIRLEREGEAAPSEDLSGTTWTHDSVGVGGTSIFTFTSKGGGSYTFTESGLGNVKGTATLSGRTLTMEWTEGAYSGSHRYALDENFAVGRGTLTWTRKSAGETRGPNFNSTITRR